MNAFATGSVLGDIEVDYGRCPHCGLVMALAPTWLDRAYDSAIADLDIGLLDRCNVFAHLTAMILRLERSRHGRYLDFAGGYGTLTRLMRDRGYAFEHHDPMADNLFAFGHELRDLGGARFDLVTGYEVLEHLVDPVADLAAVAESTNRLLLSTQLLPEPTPKPGDWWYYTPETGQHITFYTPQALQQLALKLGFDGVVVGSLVHLFFRGRRPSRMTRIALVNAKPTVLAGLLASVPDRRHSLQKQDLEAIRRRVVQG